MHDVPFRSEVVRAATGPAKACGGRGRSGGGTLLQWVSTPPSTAPVVRLMDTLTTQTGTLDGHSTPSP